MTRKDFEAVASAIAAARPASHPGHAGSYAHGFAAGAQSACEIIARSVANYMAATSPRFDRDRFLRACGDAEVITGLQS